jgi:hypothetical protein
VIGRRAGAAALLATAIAIVGGCRRARAPEAHEEPAGLAGLRAAIERERAAIGGAVDPRAAAAAILAGRELPAAAWPELVSERFRPHRGEAAAAFAAAIPAAADELAALGRAAGALPIEVRWQYADDPQLAPAQARMRVALPVGRPGAIALAGGRPLAPIFVHDGARWRALLGLDDVVAARIAARDPACAAAYRAAAREPCLAMSAPVIAAALDPDAAGLARACGRLAAACPLAP